MTVPLSELAAVEPDESSAAPSRTDIIGWRWAIASELHTATERSLFFGSRTSFAHRTHIVPVSAWPGTKLNRRRQWRNQSGKDT